MSITASAHSQRVSLKASTLDTSAPRSRATLAEARPHGADRDPVRVQHRVDGEPLLGALAPDRRGALELLRRRRAQVAQRAQRAPDVAADRSGQPVGGQALEVRDLLADALADAVDEGIELGLDGRDELPDDLGGRRVGDHGTNVRRLGPGVWTRFVHTPGRADLPQLPSAAV
jgi:hypothetical protein